MSGQRIDYKAASPGAYEAVRAVEIYVRKCGLEKSLIELVKMRASQINRCAFCLDMHSKDARHSGETEQRLYLLSGWEETSLYTPRERAALAWCGPRGAVSLAVALSLPVTSADGAPFPRRDLLN